MLSVRSVCAPRWPPWQHHLVESRPDEDLQSPSGSPYDWFLRARTLVADGSAAAALVLLDRLLHDAGPTRSVQELRARALFDTRRFAESAEAFAEIVALAPDDDYAHFGLGMSLWRLQDFVAATDHFALACVMRPARREYQHALRQVRATLAARAEAGLPLRGPIPASIDAQPLGDAHHEDPRGLGASAPSGTEGVAGDGITPTDPTE